VRGLARKEKENMTYANKIQELWTPSQVLVTEVEFLEEENAKRLTRFLNQHIGPGQASKRGNNVIVGAVPAKVMRLAYTAIGASPAHEFAK